VIPAPDPVKVREQDRDDHARLDALPEENHERREHVQVSRRFGYVSALG